MVDQRALFYTLLAQIISQYKVTAVNILPGHAEIQRYDAGRKTV
jgi:hypothetical protein